MPPAATIRLRNGDAVTEVPFEDAGKLVAAGWQPESDQAQQEREAAERFAQRNSGIGNTILTGVEGFARGVTAGGSDVVARLVGGEDTAHAMSERRQAHPWAAGIPNVLGAVAPLAFGDTAGIAGSLAAASPAAKIAGLGSRIAESGAGAGLLRSTAATVAGGAAEGALYNAGGYVSDVALGDRKLSADGFVGSLAEGGFWGGAGAGALKLTSGLLSSARKLIPAAELTGDGARAARRAAATEVAASLDDTTTLAAKADAKLADLSAQEELANPSYKQRVAEIKIQAAQDIADAQVAAARAKQGVAEARSKYATQTLEGKAAKVGAKKPTPIADLFEGLSTPIDEEAGAAGSAARSDGRRVVDRATSDEGELVSMQPKTAEYNGGKLIAEEAPAMRGAQSVQDSIHAELAKVNPQAATIQKALVEAKSAKAAMRDWMDKYGEDSSVAFDAAGKDLRKAKIQDWAKNAPVGDEAGQVAQEHFLGNPERSKMRAGGLEDSQYPSAVRAEANKAGAEAAHQAYLEATASEANVSVSGTELQARAQYASQQAAAKAQGRVYDAYHASTPIHATGEEILASQATPTEHIDAAIKAKPSDFADDIAQTAPMITKHEAAHADLADALGADAPASSQERAAAFRDAQNTAQEKASVQIANAADQLAKAPQATKSLASQLMGKATDMGATYEALRMMGVPLPDPGKIPVIGKVLSAYLKAKLLGKAFGGHAGGILSTAETAIASKSAAIRQQVYKAADAMLEGGAKATGKLSAIGGGPTAILSRQLFDTPPKPLMQSGVTMPAKGSDGALFLARSAEVNAAMQPGAVADAVKKRIDTSDPEVLSEIIATHMRKLQVVADAMPRPSGPPALIDGHAWLPSKQDLVKWTRTINAVENPADVFARAAKGMASMDEIDAVRRSYPALYADGQQHALKKIADGDVGQLTSYMKAAFSKVWDIPVDHMSQPDTAAFLQAGYQPKPIQQTPPGAPTISGPMHFDTRTMPRLDRGG